MGGQFDYAGLWIDSDFLHGHSKAGPLCTTYQSPQLSTSETFEVEEVEGEHEFHCSSDLLLKNDLSYTSQTFGQGR